MAQFVLVAGAMEILAIDALTELVIGAAIAVHTALGPGLLESIYRDALVIELTALGISVKVEEHVPVFYRGQRVRGDLKIDLLVDGRLVVEIQGCRATDPSVSGAGIDVLEAHRLPSWPASELQRDNAPRRTQATRSPQHLCRDTRHSGPLAPFLLVSCEVS